MAIDTPRFVRSTGVIWCSDDHVGQKGFRGARQILDVHTSSVHRTSNTQLRVVGPYLPLDLPHVNEILAQLGGQDVLSAEEGESPGRTVPSPI